MLTIRLRCSVRNEININYSDCVIYPQALLVSIKSSPLDLSERAPRLLNPSRSIDRLVIGFSERLSSESQPTKTLGDPSALLLWIEGRVILQV